MEEKRNIILLFLIFGSAILLAGIIKSAYILSSSFHPDFQFLRLSTYSLIALILISAHLFLRFLKWHHILRNCNIIISVKTSILGFFSGLGLIFIPLFIGELFLRSLILSKRENAVFNSVFNAAGADRAYDIFALLFWGAVFLENITLKLLCLALFLAAAFSPSLRAGMIKGLIAVAGFFLRIIRARRVSIDRNVINSLKNRKMYNAIVLSVFLWALPSLVLYMICIKYNGITMYDSFVLFVNSTFRQIFMLSSGGIISSGTYLIKSLADLGTGADNAVAAAFLFRFSTAGFSFLIGLVSLFSFRKYLFRRPPRLHFEQIAQDYDAQIPVHSNRIVIQRKMERMLSVLSSRRSLQGLDIGCGQGYYLEEFSKEGINVLGLESSKNQLKDAARRTEAKLILNAGSLPCLPYRDESFDFVYIINVLHHLPGADIQRKAIDEILRIVKKDGYLFINEINTNNFIFKLYMGYIFPMLNNIDEGIERWIKPSFIEDNWSHCFYGSLYFTFLPEFTPGLVWKLLGPAERMLEKSPLKRYSAHYISVLKKGSQHNAT